MNLYRYKKKLLVNNASKCQDFSKDLLYWGYFPQDFFISKNFFFRDGSQNEWTETNHESDK